jgi:hypothetical protein
MTEENLNALPDYEEELDLDIAPDNQERLDDEEVDAKQSYKTGFLWWAWQIIRNIFNAVTILIVLGIADSSGDGIVVAAGIIGYVAFRQFSLGVAQSKLNQALTLDSDIGAIKAHLGLVDKMDVQISDIHNRHAISKERKKIFTISIFLLIVAVIAFLYIIAI